jgi:hypothetical protein
MPRLVGKPSRTPLYVGIALLAAVAGLGALEYTGTIDLIPGFGEDQNTVRRSEIPTNKTNPNSRY